MEADKPTVVQIFSEADIDDLLARLPSLSHGHVTVSVPAESPALLTAADFSRLLTAARQARVELTMDTDDPLRRELGRMLGWAVAETPSTPNGDITAGEENPTEDLATYVPKHVRSGGSTSVASPYQVRLRRGTVVLGPDQDRDEFLARLSQETRAAEAVGTEPDYPFESSTQAVSTATSGNRRKLGLAAAVGAPLLVLVLVAALLSYVLPSATITLVPHEEEVAADLTYGVAVPGAEYDIMIEPDPIEHTVVFEQTIPATGERYEPDGTASGTVQFMNAMTTPIEIPAGTRLVGTNGVSYRTQYDVIVPAADPFGSLSLGTVTVEIVASIAGPDGNTPAGTIVGQLDNGAYFTNRDAIDGGTMRRIVVVSEDDIAALQEAAAAELSARAEPEFDGIIDPVLTLVPGSKVIEDPVIELSHEVGEDAEEVSIRATQTVRGAVFDRTQLEAQARDEVGRRLAAQAGSGVILLGPTVTIDDPVPLDEAETAFQVHASAVVRAVITTEEQEALINEVTGKSIDEVEAIVSALPNVAHFEIEHGPSWLPARMPQMASNIRVEVASGDQVGTGT